MVEGNPEQTISFRIYTDVIERIDRDRKQRQSRSEYVRVAINEKLKRGEEE